MIHSLHVHEYESRLLCRMSLSLAPELHALHLPSLLGLDESCDGIRRDLTLLHIRDVEASVVRDVEEEHRGLLRICGRFHRVSRILLGELLELLDGAATLSDQKDVVGFV